jgi:hypothetical protein
VDLLAILPFYICSGIDLRSVWAFRLLHLIRLLKLARYSKVIRRYLLPDNKRETGIQLVNRRVALR